MGRYFLSLGSIPCGVADVSGIIPGSSDYEDTEPGKPETDNHEPIFWIQLQMSMKRAVAILPVSL